MRVEMILILKSGFGDSWGCSGGGAAATRRILASNAAAASTAIATKFSHGNVVQGFTSLK